MKYNEIEGDLIQLTKKGNFNVIAHGCNCFCRMKRGIAPQMAITFGCDKYRLEDFIYEGDSNKLGQIDFRNFHIENGNLLELRRFSDINLSVVNCYTQYHWSSKENPNPFDYEALTLCMRKMNHVFKGKHIGLPKIGAGLAGGDWNKIKEIIQKELKDCQVTIVIKNN